VATADNERAWLEAARGRTARQIEELVARHRPGDGPDDPYDGSLRRHVLRFEVTAETMATFREAMTKLRREAGSAMSDDAALLLLARQILGGPADAGRANYQVAMTLCEQCGRAWQGRGDRVEVGPDVVEMATCDAQHIGRTHVGGSRARQDVPPATRRQVIRRDGGRCVVPGWRHGTFLDLHHVALRSEGGHHDPDTLATLCGAHHRAAHRGQLVIEGRVSNGLVFRHADGTPYGSVVNPRVAATHSEAFRALRSLGFREAPIRSALERIRRRDDLAGASVDQVLREALSALAN
jgi:5-methylcytosine-specific restriction endonuclease McrA